jgi:hypothetical protein
MRKDSSKIVDRIQLAAGQVTESEQPVHRLTVELIKTRDGSELAVIIWPAGMTRVPSRKLGETIARVCRILANSNVELAARHRRKR